MNNALPVPANRRQLATLDQLAAIPEEEIWLAKQKSPQTRRAARRAPLFEKAGHGGQPDAPLFRPLRGNGKPLDPAGRMDPDAIDRMVRKYAAMIGLGRGYSAHSMRATFITTALENGAHLEDVQKARASRSVNDQAL